MYPQAFLLLGAALLSAAAWLIAFVAALQRQWRLAAQAAVVGGGVATGYALLVVGVAAAAPERLLALGEEKYICELDCHLAYSVQQVRHQGDSLFIRLKVRFAGETAGSDRPAGRRLYPGWRRVRLRDEHGNEYPPLSLGDLGRTLLPGEAYETELIFDVDPGATGLVLYIADADPAKWVLLGSDNAPFRTPAGFRLAEK